MKRKPSQPSRSTRSKIEESRSDRNIRWIEKHCIIPDGRDVGKPVVLREWQRDILRAIYDNPHGTRRAIISLGRKNAKTALSAFLLLLHLAGPEAKKRPNSQLFSAAQSRDQAGVIFNLAAKVIQLSPTLRPPTIIIRETAKQLACPHYGTLYRALSAEASTAYGLSPAFIVHDELGQVKGPRSPLYDALETATGAQVDPLSIVISTQAPTDADLLSVLVSDAQSGHDPRTVLCLYTCPKDHPEPFSEEAIRLANPAFGDFLNPVEVLAMASDAKRMPSREAEYRNLVLNQRVEANSPFVTKSVWDANAGDPMPDFAGCEVYGGLDLSSVSDLTALVLLTKVGERWHLKPTFWLPKNGLPERARKDAVPYDLWERDGFLLATPGSAIEYEYVADFLRRIFDTCDVRSIAFDRWGWKHFKPWLERAGFNEEELERFVEFGQGFQSMSPALRDFESLLLENKIEHGGHPVLTMCAQNAVVKTDPAGNRKLDKAKSNGRIDGMVAATMAVGAAGIALEERSILDIEFEEMKRAAQREPAH